MCLPLCEQTAKSVHTACRSKNPCDIGIRRKNFRIGFALPKWMICFRSMYASAGLTVPRGQLVCTGRLHID